MFNPLNHPKHQANNPKMFLFWQLATLLMLWLILGFIIGTFVPSPAGLAMCFVLGFITGRGAALLWPFKWSEYWRRYPEKL